MSWISPVNVIDRIVDYQTKKIDNMIIEDVRKVIETHIDKEALLDALNGSREQYEKGYAEGRKDAINAIKVLVKKGTPLSKGHWIQQPRCEGDEQPDLVCPNCGFKISWWDMGNFCAKCGKGLQGDAG